MVDILIGYVPSLQLLAYSICFTLDGINSILTKCPEPPFLIRFSFEGTVHIIGRILIR
jgi:hypothetical protein